MKKLLLLALAGLFTINAYAGTKKVLVVLSSENKLSLKNGVIHPTGFFLSELMVSVKTLLDAGYEPVFANPLGNRPSLDLVSDSAVWFGGSEFKFQEMKKLLAGMQGLQRPLRLAEVRAQDLSQYAGILVPGGHAPMEDLLVNADLGLILHYFHKMQKPTALICHGPIALLSTLSQPEIFVKQLSEGKTPTIQTNWIYQDYAMTAFSTKEEQQEEPGQDNVLGGFVKFYPDEALGIAGGKTAVRALKWQSHVIRDRELITGQNPMSDVELANAFLEALVNSNLRNKKPQAWYSQVPQTGTLYQVRNQKIDWTKGYSTLFVGKRKASIGPQKFLEKVQAHVNDVYSAFKSQGLKGYFFIVTEDTEIAYFNWESEVAANRAFGTTAGKAIVADANEFIEPVLFKEVAEQPLFQ